MTATTWKMQLIAAAVSLLLISMLVLRVSSAAFTAETENAANNWETGTIALTDDDGGTASSAMFDVTGMLPGAPEVRCITVTYTGEADPTPVKLWATVTDGGLADHLDVTVEEGDGGAYGDCTGFVASASPVSNLTLTAFGADHGSFANGVGTWDPAVSATGESKTYRFTVTLGTDTPQSAQGGDAQATFTWRTTT